MKLKRALYRWAHVLLPAAVILSACWLKVASNRWTEQLQLTVFDAYQRRLPRPYRSAPVRIVDINEESLARLGQWPWPRTRLAELVSRLSSLGAAAVAFDMVFAEPDRTSPARVSRSWPAAARAAASSLADNDEAFAKAIGSSPVVLGMALLGKGGAAAPPPKARFAFSTADGEPPLDYIPDFPGAARNLPVLEKAAAGLGSISMILDADNVVRRPQLLSRRGDVLVPSLSIEALRVAQGQPGIAVKAAGGSGEKGAKTGLSRMKVGSFQFPVDADGRFWVHYTKPAPERYVSAWRVLAGKADPASFQGDIVFVGASAMGLRDARATPLDPAAPGVETHANVVEQILSQDFLARPDWALGAELSFMILVGLLLLVLLPRLGAAWCALAAAAAVAAAWRFSWTQFASHGLLIDPLYPSLIIVGVYMTSSLISYLKTEAERRQVKTAFSRYMAPALVEQLARHPEKLRLGGETREMTFHFCDIRGFTTISERFDPHGLTQFINRFLTPMTDIILSHQGVIDKYMGDCIMAFWNAPLDDAEHARHACRAALAMHSRLYDLNKEWEAEAKAAGREYLPIRIGTGLNTGRCVVGNMGSDQRFDYSVLGDDVNLASRLEGQSKNYGVDIVLGPKTREQAPEFAALELDLIKVKGKTVPVRVYALLGGPELAANACFKVHKVLHERMLAAYRERRWDDARSLLAECRKLPLPLEKLYDLYADRLSVFASAAPPAEWDGTFTATSK